MQGLLTTLQAILKFLVRAVADLVEPMFLNRNL